MKALALTLVCAAAVALPAWAEINDAEGGAMKKLASQKGVRLPERIGAREQADLLRLKALSGERFDRSYMADMLKDHEKDEKETHEIAAITQDPDLKKAVQEANAKIREHLRLARQVESSK